MSNKEILEHASRYFKQNYPGLTAESVVCFLVLIDLGDDSTVGDVARAVGMAEPSCYQHMAQLTAGVGAGLVTLQNTGDGKNYVLLTEQGNAAKQAVLAAFT
jgi:hypothetical protein